MPRKKKQGDIAYNARRREYRAAQRYLKKAEKTTGATSAYNKALAREHLIRSLETYDPKNKQALSSSIVNLGAQLGIDVRSSEFRVMDEKKRIQAVKRSESALEGRMTDEQTRKEEESRVLMSNKEIGHRIMGGLVEIWKPYIKKGASAAENRAAAEKAIFDYFGASSWVDILDKLKQSMGDELYSIASDLEMYDVVKIGLQIRVATNSWS